MWTLIRNNSFNQARIRDISEKFIISSTARRGLYSVPKKSFPVRYADCAFLAGDSHWVR